MATKDIYVPPSKCVNYSYVPTTHEYIVALGSFGPAVLVIGGLITVGLYILFFEQAFFTNANAHRRFRRHIYWIASVYPFMTLMSVIALAVPRAHNICTAVKVTYMSIGISHFADLTVVMFGGEDVMLAKTEGDFLNLQVLPTCCCCLCLPTPPVTKFSLRLVMLLSDQLPFTQAAYYVIVLILLSADNITLGNVNPNGVYLWLAVFNLASFLTGVYSLQILTYFSKGHLEAYKYKSKSWSMTTLVLVTNCQSLVFDIMANYEAFPCIPPFLSPQVYKQTVENSIYLIEMMVLGAYTYYHYHNFQFLKPFAPLEVPQSQHRAQHQWQEKQETQCSLTEGKNSSDDRNSSSSGSRNERISIASTSTMSTIVENEGRNRNGSISSGSTSITMTTLAENGITKSGTSNSIEYSTTAITTSTSDQSNRMQNNNSSISRATNSNRSNNNSTESSAKTSKNKHKNSNDNRIDRVQSNSSEHSGLSAITVSVVSTTSSSQKSGSCQNFPRDVKGDTITSEQDRETSEHLNLPHIVLHEHHSEHPGELKIPVVQLPIKAQQPETVVQQEAQIQQPEAVAVEVSPSCVETPNSKHSGLAVT